VLKLKIKKRFLFKARFYTRVFVLFLPWEMIIWILMRVVRKPKKRIIVAMDEAGRGPLAGPVSVAGMAFCITGPAIFNFSRQLRDPASAGQFLIFN